jgi:hypothetical protein
MGKIERKMLAGKKNFYNTLTETHIDTEDYEHAKRVWKHYNFKCLGEYSDWYHPHYVLVSKWMSCFFAMFSKISEIYVWVRMVWTPTITILLLGTASMRC